MRAMFHYDWCPECTEKMELTKKQLYMLPQTVGHYVSHKEAEYYKKNLVKVEKKADIPPGIYACGIYRYCCPKCDKKVIRLSIFLPVRDEEKYEDTIIFQNGEMDNFIYNK